MTTAMSHSRDTLDVTTALREEFPQGLVTQAPAESTMIENLLPLPVQDANSIQELTAKMKDGDEAAFSAFYERYCDRLFRYLIVLTRGDEDRSRDLLQATMTKVVRSVRRFADERQFWNWLAVIARNCFIDAFRKAQRTIQVVPLLPEDAPIMPQSATADDDAPLFDALEDCLAAMGAEERELIEAFYFKEGSHESVARERQTTPKAVESKLARVRQKLRTAILKRLHHENS
jgi:RNA polymerase sigma-70 factor (ECF subfamily)